MKINFKINLIISLLIILIILLLPLALGEIFINEFLPNGINEPESEWVELYNNGSANFDLTGFNISENGASGNITLNIIIPAKGFIILVQNFGIFNLTYPNANRSDIKIIEYGSIVSSFQLSNTAGFLDLYNSSGSKIDNISYSSTSENISIGRFPDAGSTITTFQINTPGNKNDKEPPILNKWIKPQFNNSVIGNIFNVTVNITDLIYSVNVSFINFNNTNFSMQNNKDIWYFLWNTTLNSEAFYNLKIFFNDSLGISNTETLFNIFIDNTKPKILNPNITSNSRNFISPGFEFNISVNATDTNLLNITCKLNEIVKHNFTSFNNIHTCSLIAPSNEADFGIILTAFDIANNSNFTSLNFTTKHKTLIDLNPENIIISDKNISVKIVEVNITLNNTGTSPIYDAGIIIDSFSTTSITALNTYQSCSPKLEPLQSCNNKFTITIGSGIAPGTYKIFWNANWTNNNFSIFDLQSIGLPFPTSNLIILSNPQITVPKNITETLKHGENLTLTIKINSTGNDNLNDINITFLPETLPSSFIMITPQNFETIPLTINQSFNITVQIPKFTSPGNYTGSINISAQNTNAKTITLTIEVPVDESWTSFPAFQKNFRKTNLAGFLANITINNSGNIGHNFTLKFIGNLKSFIWNQSNDIFEKIGLYVEKNHTKTITLYHLDNGPLTTYNLNATITSNNASTKNISIIELTRDNNAPFINITNPMENSFVKDIITINVNANDLNLSRIEYYINQTLVLNSKEILSTFIWNSTNGSFPDNLYNIKAIAFDSANSFNLSEINVTLNNTDDLPIFLAKIPNIQIIEDNFSIINLSSFFKTIDGDSLKYNFSSIKNILININNETQTANISPIENFFGKEYVIFTAIDSSRNSTSSNNITINVTNINDAPSTPILTSPPNSTNILSATGSATLSWAASQEPDNQTITYFVFFSNDSSTLSTKLNATTQSTILEVKNLKNGTYFWNIIASDSIINSSISETFRFVLNSDNKPIISFWQWNNTISQSSSLTTNNQSPVAIENSSIEFKALAIDLDNDKINFTWFINSSLKTAKQNMTLNFSNNFTAKGFYNITLIVADNNSNLDSIYWNLTILNLNILPVVIKIPNHQISEESSLTITNLSNFFTDADLDDKLVFVVKNENISKVDCIINENNLTLKGAIDFAGNGTNAASCTIIAFDNTDNSTNNTFLINVSNINDAPILNSIIQLTASQEILFFYDVNATDADLNFNDVLTFKSNSTLFKINSSNGIINFTPSKTDVGLHRINISVIDIQGLQSAETILFSIENVNDAPILDEISDKNATEDFLITFNITASDSDGNNLTFTSNLTGITFIKSVNNSFVTLFFSPSNENVGINTINITVNDSLLTDSRIFNIIVNNTNDPPIIISIFPKENKTIAENIGIQKFNITAIENDISDNLSIKWFQNKTLIANQTLNMTITGLMEGVYNITAIAKDLSGAEARNQWRLNVSSSIFSDALTSNVLKLNQSQRQSAVNISVSHPIFGSIDFGNESLNFSGIAVLEDVFNISSGFISIDTDKFKGLNKSAFILLKGLNFSKTPLIFSSSGFETISENNLCPEFLCKNITYDKKNGMLSFLVSHFTTYSAQINTTNGAPIIISSPVINAVENQQYSYDVEAEDPDLNPLTFTLTNFPTGMSINPSNGVINWIPSSSQLGLHNVTLFVSDNNLTANQNFEINVGKGAKLIISDLDIKVDGSSDKNIRNNTRVKDELKPNSNIEFSIEIENKFTNEENLEIEDIEVDITIEDIDDGDDIEEEADAFDLDVGDEDSVDIDFSIPSEIDEGFYNAIINVEGRDTNGTFHTIHWVVELEVEKESHDLIIRNLNINPSTLSCSRIATLSLQILNQGKDDEDEVTAEILNNRLNVNFRETDIEIQEGTDDNIYEKTLTINVPENLESGVYPVNVNAYYDNDKLDDTKSVDLNIQDCETIVKKKEPVKEKPAEIIEIIKPKVTPQAKPQITQITFRDTDTYFLLLLMTFILLFGLLVIGFIYLARIR